MAGTSRRSLGAVYSELESIIPANDDEAERTNRRMNNRRRGASTSSVDSNTSANSISNLSSIQLNQRIEQCIKLNIENKINRRNAFQLKLIDFLLYALKRNDANANLALATAALDASTNIYGHRVDQVHSDSLKISGVNTAERNSNKDDEVADDAVVNNNKGRQKKKTRRYVICKVEELKANVETYDSLSLTRCQRDIQTSDMLFQAALPQHANQGAALNLYNDVMLDKIIENSDASLEMYIIHKLEDYSVLDLCPSYASFKFLDGSPNDGECQNQDENDGEYHFDMDASSAVPDAGVIENDVTIDGPNAYEETARNNQYFEDIVDFQEIVNNADPNATYEYSYLPKDFKINWAGSSHWKITFNKKTLKPTAGKRKKDFELTFTDNSKEEVEAKFSPGGQKQISIKTRDSVWSEDKLTFPEAIHYEPQRLYKFFSKPTQHLEFASGKSYQGFPAQSNEDNSEQNNDHDWSNLAEPHQPDGGFFGDNNEDEPFTQNPSFTQQASTAQSQGAFVGDNLVSVPKLTDKVFIPHSRRAKQIDMKQLKGTIWKDLKKSANESERENFGTSKSYEIEPRVFSDMYKDLPKSNSNFPSPAIAFVSLLHLATEKNLNLVSDSNLSNVIIKDGRTEDGGSR